MKGLKFFVIGIAAGDELFSDQIIEVTILDNDTRGVEISPTRLNLTEGERGSYTVVLTSQPNTGNVTVIATSNDPARLRIGDITAESMPSDLVFSTENWHIPRIVQITTSPDSGGDAEVEITHQVMADVGGDYTGETAADVVVTVGQRPLSVSLTLAGAATTVAEGARVTLSAELSSAVANETVVRLVVVGGGPNAADDADIVIEGDVFSVTIAAGVALGTTEFTVLDDDIAEGDEILMIIGIAGGDVIPSEIIEVTILDNDTRGVEISETRLNLTEGEGGNYTVVLTSQPNTGNVTVIAASSDTARVHIVDIDLVFSAENWHIPQTVQITTSSDTDETDNEVAITHQVVADVGGDYTGETAADVVVTVEEGGGGNGGGGSGGGGGSLGLWALVALALAHPLGPWRRRPRHSRAPSHLPNPLA